MAPPALVVLVMVCLALLILLTPSLVWESRVSRGEHYWLHSLLINIIGYCSVLLPGYAVYKYVHATNLLHNPGGGRVERVLRLIYGDNDELPTSSSGRSPLGVRRETLHLLLCFTGLQGSYLTWGVLQEKVMTQSYGEESGGGGGEGRFRDSQFLVFVNRVLALGLSALYLVWRHQPRLTAPLYKFSFSSLSNIMSSWCQYEALKYVSFPTQVLAKASKIIPVMLMGKIVSRQKYEYYEYVTAVIISAGMFFFMLSTAPAKESLSGETTASGVMLLVGYLCLDSFTSSWQSDLFSRYRISPVQMMCCVNLFSCLLTAASLLQQGSFLYSFNFVSQYPRFGVDCVLLSLASGAGQLFIFETISRFGAIVFTVMMTVRQALAVLLSCLIYSHPLPPAAALAAASVFSAILLRLYCRYRLHTPTLTRSPPSTSPSPPKL